MSPAPPETKTVRFNSIEDLMPRIGHIELDDYVLDLCWSPDGQTLAALPSTGAPLLLNPVGEVLRDLPAHRGGNGSMGWSPKGDTLATIGLDSLLRIHETDPTASRELALPKGWSERCAWNADGSRIAVACDRTVQIVDVKTLEIEHLFEGHRASVCDLLWHPCQPDQFATASDGGARIWRLGEKEPIGIIDDGVAALSLTWSPDGRWLVTGDQTPSVHLLKVSGNDPLYIQGFETKVRTFAWLAAGRKDVPWLAAGGSSTITLWPCFGKEGPRGTEPQQLIGHEQEVTALAIPKIGHYLASGDREGLVLFWLPHEIERPVMITREPDEITVLRWSPDGQTLAIGTSEGHVILHKVK